MSKGNDRVSLVFAIPYEHHLHPLSGLPRRRCRRVQNGPCAGFRQPAGSMPEPGRRPITRCAETGASRRATLICRRCPFFFSLAPASDAYSASGMAGPSSPHSCQHPRRRSAFKHTCNAPAGEPVLIVYEVPASGLARPRCRWLRARAAWVPCEGTGVSVKIDTALSQPMSSGPRLRESKTLRSLVHVQKPAGLHGSAAQRAAITWL